MILLLKSADGRLVFDNVVRIEERTKPSVLGGTRTVINLFNEDGDILMGGDDIDLTGVEVSVLPNAEKE